MINVETLILLKIISGSVIYAALGFILSCFVIYEYRRWVRHKNVTSSGVLPKVAWVTPQNVYPVTEATVPADWCTRWGRW